MEDPILKSLEISGSPMKTLEISKAKPPALTNADKDDKRSSLTNLIKRKWGGPKAQKISALFADKIPVISYEKNGSEERFEIWSLDSSLVARNDDRGKVADLGTARPVRFVNQNKVYLAYRIDGDRGIAIDLEMDTSLLKITNTAEEAWALIQSAKLARVFTDDITGRSKLMYMAAGGIVTLIGYFILLRFL